jgi:hypothetical protein
LTGNRQEKEASKQGVLFPEAIPTENLSRIYRSKDSYNRDMATVPPSSAPLKGELGEILVEFDLKTRLWGALRLQGSYPGVDIIAYNSSKRIDYKIEVTTYKAGLTKKLKGEKFFDILVFVKTASPSVLQYYWNDGTVFDPDSIFGPLVLQW